MKKKELDAMCDAYKHLLEQKAEKFDMPYVHGTYKRISRKDYEVLKPLFEATRQLNYKIGKVEIQIEERLGTGAIVFENVVFVNAERCNEHMQDFYRIISHLMI